MANEQGHGRWTAPAQAFAAVTGALVAVAGLVIGVWRPAEHAPTAAATPTPPAAATAAPKRSGGPVAIEPGRVSLSWQGEADDSGARQLVAVIEVRITNTGELPVAAAWLDARRSAALDLDQGTHLAAGSTAVFAGFDDCPRDKARSCDEDKATRLDPGEGQQATITLVTGIGESQQKALATAKTARLTARLALIPGMDRRAAYARAVSLTFPVTNNAS